MTASLMLPINTSVATNSTNTTNSMSSTLTILQPCSPQADLLCGQSLWTPEFLQDAEQMLLLKAAAANSQTTQRLDTWRGSVPPCTNSTISGSCVECDESVPADMCGKVRPGDGAQLCNWRYITCRERRVISINLANQVGTPCVLCRAAAEHVSEY
jgi:hypothetical protein